MSTGTKQYGVGSVLEYVAFDGATRTVTVTGKHSDIKNGRAGFEGIEGESGDPIWGYDYQIKRVLIATCQHNRLNPEGRCINCDTEAL